MKLISITEVGNHEKIDQFCQKLRSNNSKVYWSSEIYPDFKKQIWKRNEKLYYRVIMQEIS